MTFILGWQEDDEVFVCADSAATRKGKPEGATSSFGEAQEVDHYAVEERAVKLLELSRGVLVAVCGNSGCALEFVESMHTRLAFTGKAMRDILRDVSAATDLHDEFELLIAHRADGKPLLTAFHSSGRIEDVGTVRYATLGSLPSVKKELACRLITTVRNHPLPAEARLAGALTALQAMGINDYLPQYCDAPAM